MGGRERRNYMSACGFSKEAFPSNSETDTLRRYSEASVIGQPFSWSIRPWSFYCSAACCCSVAWRVSDRLWNSSCMYSPSQSKVICVPLPNSAAVLRVQRAIAEEHSSRLHNRSDYLFKDRRSNRENVPSTLQLNSQFVQRPQRTPPPHSQSRVLISTVWQ